MKRTKRQRRLPVTQATSKRSKVSNTKVAYDVSTDPADPIGHRMAMMMSDPSASPSPEFADMGREKMTVGGEVVMAMMHKALGAHRAWSDYWFHQMQRSCSVLPELGASRTPTRLMQVATNSVGASIADFFALCMNAANFSEVHAKTVTAP